MGNGKKILATVFMCAIVLLSCDEKSVKVSSVAVDPTSILLTVGEETKLIATVSPSDAENKSVVWVSNNYPVATVDDSGVVTAVSAGTASITVTTNDGGKTAVCEVTVIEEEAGDD